MPAADSDTLARASEVIGSQASSGIWLRTQPLPWQTAGTGSVLGLLLPALAEACKAILPSRRNDTETLLNHDGPVLCTRTFDEIVFAGCESESDSGKPICVLRKYPISGLSSYSYDYPNTSEVEFHFGADGSLTLHFFGDENHLEQFASSLST
ncbi:MAG: hypothetical protein AAF394_02120 [Planctomycetota bacterium]